MCGNMEIKRTFFLIAISLTLAASLAAQSSGLTLRSKDGSAIGNFSGSYALVIGESEYRAGWARLPGAKQDARAVAKLLEESGFLVTVREDLDFAALKAAFEDFIDRYGLDEGNRLLFYYAGHGHTLKLAGGRDMGYIVPVDAPSPGKDELGFKRLALPMQQFDTWARRIESRHALFVFDSCFSGSVFNLTRAAATSAFITDKTLKPVRQFVTSGSADEVVSDNSVFRAQFAAALSGEGDRNGDGYVTGVELGEYLRETVMKYTRSAQHPQFGTINDPALDKGDFVFEAKLRPDAAAAAAERPAETRPYKPTPGFVRIPGGTFRMGSPAVEANRKDDEVQHDVTLRAFSMGPREVTQAEWKAVMGTNPSFFKGDDLPVENVSWYDVLVYCNRRSLAEGIAPAYRVGGSADPDDWGLVPSEPDGRWDEVACDFSSDGYRLPTEAEWEYACRSGTATPFSFGTALSTADANYDGKHPYAGAPAGERRERTLPAGSFKPNAFGLFDMHGNVYEWVWDWYGPYDQSPATDPTGPKAGEGRVHRGGSWGSYGLYLRSAARKGWAPHNRNANLGFHVVRSAP